MVESVVSKSVRAGNGLVSPISAAEVAATRQPTRRANLLPPRVYHDQDVFDYEREAWFAGGWICVGREEDALTTGAVLPGPRWPARTSSSCGATTASSAPSTTSAATAGRRSSRRSAAPWSASSAPTTPGSTTCAAVSASPATPSMLENFDPAEWGLVPVRLGVWQGYVFLNLSGEAPALLDVPGRHARRLRPLRPRRAAPGAGDRLRRRRQLEGAGRELRGVLPLPGRPPPAEPDHPLQPGRRHARRGAVAGQLDGGDRRLRDAVDRRRAATARAPLPRDGRRRPASASTTTSSGPTC